MTGNDAPKIAQRELETQFTYFYDMRARILKITPPTDLEELKHVTTFGWISVEESDLNASYFSDNYPTGLISAHFHGRKESIISATPDFTVPLVCPNTNGGNCTFGMRDIPTGLPNELPSYCCLEVSIFKNGIMVLVIRTENLQSISAEDYVYLIARPERVRRPAAPDQPGPLVARVDAFLPEIEKKLVDCLSKCKISGIDFRDGIERQLQIFANDSEKYRTGSFPIYDSSSINIEMGQTITEARTNKIYHRLKRSRPYVGTVLSQKEPSTDPEQLQKFAIACGRTTPEFYYNFDRPGDYLAQGDPPRNVYHPGPSIVFIGRRGWCCLKLDPRDPVAFQMGIVDTVSFSLQAILAYIRASRRFLRDLLLKEEDIGLQMMTGVYNDETKEWTKPFQKFDLNKINAFSALIASARINSPLDDYSTLLKSHVITHTGLAAIERVKQLSDYRELTETGRAIFNKYDTVLRTAGQYHRSKREFREKIGLIVMVLLFIVGIILGV